MNAPSQRLLLREVRDLTLVAIGAIPGALGRWGCELLGERVSGGLRGVIEGDFAANMLGCLLMGLVLALPPSHQRVFLWAGIGFCGSLTTFSSWMLQLSTTLQGGKIGGSLVVLLSTLIGGLILMSTSYILMLRWLTDRAARP
jgi:CrcB protein